MSSSDRRKLFVCYLHGLDRRSVNEADTPHLWRMLQTCAVAEVETLPTNELPSTVISGVPPHVHGLWQVARRATPSSTPADRLLSALPDWVSTTWQCVRHLVDAEYDLPAMERHRRRWCEIQRYKSKRLKGRRPMAEIGGVATVFGVLGDRSRLVFAKTFEKMAMQLPGLGRGDVDLEFYETYAYDLFQHWNLDRPAAMRAKVAELDRFVAQVEKQCAASGVTLLVFSDHGQEPVTRSIDVKALLRHIGVPRDEYLYYVEAQVARFWFDTERARAIVVGLLDSLEGVTLVTNRQLHEHGICFEDESRGEVYAYTDHGTLFFPHDFYSRLANFFMAVTERSTMGRRMFNPVQRGYHGHLKRHVAEEGFLILRDPAAKAAPTRVALTDVAPTILGLLGEPIPESMKGRPAFQVERTAPMPLRLAS